MRTDDEGFQLRPELSRGSGMASAFAVATRDNRSGSSQSGHERNRLFLSQRGEQFCEVSGVGGVDSDADGRSFAIGDFDRDGWSDMVLVNANAPLTELYRNTLGDAGPAAGRRALALRFVGANMHATPSGERSNRDGYGALVRVELDGRTLTREHRCGEGLAAQNSTTMLVGLGDAPQARGLSVTWPSGTQQESGPVAAGALVTIYEDATMSPTGEAFVVESYRTPAAATPEAQRAPPTADVPALDLPSLDDPAAAAPLELHVAMATWCAACLAELPVLDELRAAFGTDQMRMVGIPVDPSDTPDALRAYATKHEPAYELQADMPPQERARVQEHLEETLRVEALPAAIVTDADGRVLLTRRGVPSVSELRALLERR